MDYELIARQAVDTLLALDERASAKRRGSAVSSSSAQLRPARGSVNCAGAALQQAAHTHAHAHAYGATTALPPPKAAPAKVARSFRALRGLPESSSFGATVAADDDDDDAGCSTLVDGAACAQSEQSTHTDNKSAAPGQENVASATS